MAALLGLSQKEVIGIVIAAALVIILLGAFIKPSPHEVRTPDAVALNTRIVDSDPPVDLFEPVQPSQSLDEIRCAMWRLRHAQTAVCPDAATLAGLYFPKLTQSPSTPYIPWVWCAATSLGAEGFNVEFQPSRRAIVIHCYLAKPWFWRQPQTSPASPRPLLRLLLVPTALLPAGPISVIEDDRIEHLIGDQSTEYQMATATIA